VVCGVSAWAWVCGGVVYVDVVRNHHLLLLLLLSVLDLDVHRISFVCIRSDPVAKLYPVCVFCCAPVCVFRRDPLFYLFCLLYPGMNLTRFPSRCLITIA
jgi:hypothetical protein